MQPPVLTPATLFEEQRRRDTLKLDTYNRILSAVHTKIRAAPTLPTSPQTIIFDVPEWQPGCPSFDVKDCILYVVWQLRSTGFRVAYVSPNRLIISWKEHSIEYYQNESPIRQAMLAAAAAASPAPAPAPAAPPPKKKAAAYRPSTGGPTEDRVVGVSSRGSTKLTFI
jgi:hypothetical protein